MFASPPSLVENTTGNPSTPDAQTSMYTDASQSQPASVKIEEKINETRGKTFIEDHELIGFCIRDAQKILRGKWFSGITPQQLSAASSYNFLQQLCELGGISEEVKETNVILPSEHPILELIANGKITQEVLESHPGLLIRMAGAEEGNRMMKSLLHHVVLKRPLFANATELNSFEQSVVRYYLQTYPRISSPDKKEENEDDNVITKLVASRRITKEMLAVVSINPFSDPINQSSKAIYKHANEFVNDSIRLVKDRKKYVKDPSEIVKDCSIFINACSNFVCLLVMARQWDALRLLLKNRWLTVEMLIDRNRDNGSALYVIIFCYRKWDFLCELLSAWESLGIRLSMSEVFNQLNGLLSFWPDEREGITRCLRVFYLYHYHGLINLQANVPDVISSETHISLTSVIQYFFPGALITIAREYLNKTHCQTLPIETICAIASYSVSNTAVVDNNFFVLYLVKQIGRFVYTENLLDTLQLNEEDRSRASMKIYLTASEKSFLSSKLIELVRSEVSNGFRLTDQEEKDYQEIFLQTFNDCYAKYPRLVGVTRQQVIDIFSKVISGLNAEEIAKAKNPQKALQSMDHLDVVFFDSIDSVLSEPAGRRVMNSRSEQKQESSVKFFLTPDKRNALGNEFVSAVKHKVRGGISLTPKEEKIYMEVFCDSMNRYNAKNPKSSEMSLKQKNEIFKQVIFGLHKERRTKSVPMPIGQRFFSVIDKVCGDPIVQTARDFSVYQPRSGTVVSS